MISFLIGIALGILYFGGLYLSIQKLNSVKHPSLLMVASFTIRMGLLIGTFFYISKGTYKDILFTLVGVILVRFVMTFTVKNKDSIKRGD